MHSIAYVIAAAILAPVAFAAPQAAKLPACSISQSSPCSCSSDDYYYETSTLGVIGANINDARKLMDDFYHTSWYANQTPIKTQGPDNKVGSIRTFNNTEGEGTTGVFSEQLMKYKINNDGAFVQHYEQYIDPKDAKQGVKPGFYVSLQGTPAYQYETIITIKTWGCWKGETPVLSPSHEAGLRGAIAALKGQGVLKGITPSNFISTAHNAK